MKTKRASEGRACRFVLAIAWPIAAVTIAAFAQQPAPPAAFEVASVRLSAPNAGSPQQRLTDTRVDLVNVPLRSVLLLAFRVEEYEISAPSWLSDTFVDIHATLPSGATRQQVPGMLQQLLAERFGLATRRERRPVEAYELEVGEDGIKMQEVEPLNELDGDFPIDPGFTSPAARAQANTVADTPDGPVRTVFGDLGRTTITGQSRYQLKLSDRRTQLLNATRMTMAELARVLQRVTGQPVVDRTGLAGLYRFTMELPLDAKVIQMLDRSASSFGGSLVELPNVSAPRAVAGLGLRLERRRSQFDTIVVDRIERVPTAN